MTLRTSALCSLDWGEVMSIYLKKYRWKNSLVYDIL